MYTIYQRESRSVNKRKDNSSASLGTNGAVHCAARHVPSVVIASQWSALARSGRSFEGRGSDFHPPVKFGAHLFRCMGELSECLEGLDSVARSSAPCSALRCLWGSENVSRFGRNADSVAQLRLCKQSSQPLRAQVKGSQ